MAASYQIRNILPHAEDVAGSRPFTRQDGGNGYSQRDRGRARAPSLEENIFQSVRTVERAVENFGALKENCQYFKDIASELRRELEQERAELKAAHRQLDDLEHQIRSERERSSRSEERSAVAEAVAKDLERELETVRGQTEHLVNTISQLVAAEIDVRSDSDESSHRFAA